MVLKLKRLNHPIIWFFILFSHPSFVYFNVEFFNNYMYWDLVLSWEFIILTLIGFLIKFPIYILHFWLPKAHVESPTSGRMLLAGLLLKFGTIGLVHFTGAIYFLNLFYLCLIAFLGIIFCSFICIVQSASKSLVAYSSIVHMGFLLLIFLVSSILTKNASLIIMVSHGFVSTSIFFYVGEFYHSSFTRTLYFLGGFIISNFLFCYFFSFFILLNRGMPPSLSFLSEFVGVVSSLNSCFLFIIPILFYFLFSFYYCGFLLINIFLGKFFLNIFYIPILYSISFFFMDFNTIWFTGF